MLACQCKQPPDPTPPAAPLLAQAASGGGGAPHGGAAAKLRRFLGTLLSFFTGRYLYENLLAQPQPGKPAGCPFAAGGSGAAAPPAACPASKHAAAAGGAAVHLHARPAGGDAGQ